MKIRVLTAHDAANVYQMIELSRPQLSNLVWSANATLESTIDYLNNKYHSRDTVHGIFTDDGWFMGIVELRVVQKKSGTWDHEITENLELGYWLGTPYCGKGVMKNAVKQLIALLRNSGETRPITAHIRSANVRSYKVLVHAGLVLDHIELWKDEIWIHFKTPAVETA